MGIRTRALRPHNADNSRAARAARQGHSRRTRGQTSTPGTTLGIPAPVLALARLTIPTIAFSRWAALAWVLASAVPGHTLVSPVLGSAVFLYGGRVFLKGGWDEIRLRQPGMMLLISLAIAVAFASSVAHEFGLVDLDFWWELAALVTVMLLGHWQEMRALG